MGKAVGGAVTAPALAAEPDELPSGLGLSFISKRRQMVGLALAQPPQPPKVCFRDGCGEQERCRGGRGTSAGADKVGGGGCGGGSGGGGGGCSLPPPLLPTCGRAYHSSPRTFWRLFSSRFRRFALSVGHVSKEGRHLRTSVHLFKKKENNQTEKTEVNHRQVF